MSQPYFPPPTPPPPPPPAPPPAAAPPPPPAGTTLAELWSQQAAGMAELAVGRAGLVLGLELLAILLVQGALRWALRRWGERSGRTALAALARFGVRVTAVLVGVSLVLERLFAVVPLFTAGALGLGLAGFAFSAGSRLQAWLMAWGTVLRGRLRLGDHLALGAVRGVVERLGLLRIHLRTEAGGVVFLPTRMLTETSLEVSTPERSFPVELVLSVDALVDAAALARARAVASLCPYRVWTSEVTVSAAGERQLRVRLLAWSAAAAERAEAYLRAALTASG